MHECKNDCLVRNFHINNSKCLSLNLNNVLDHHHEIQFDVLDHEQLKNDLQVLTWKNDLKT